jgi:hypothetical protein
VRFVAVPADTNSFAVSVQRTWPILGVGATECLDILDDQGQPIWNRLGIL